MSLQDRMVDYRAANGLSIEKAARECGISIVTWRYIEKGLQSPTRVTERKIEMFLDKKGEPNASINQSD